MSSSVGSEECDIYTDLPVTLSADYEEENKSLKEKIKVLEKKLRVVKKEKHELNEKYFQTQKNISSLFKTAVTEVNRKKRTIDDLRTQLENSVFRRNKRQRTDSPVHDRAKTGNSRNSEVEKKPQNLSDNENKSSREEHESESKERLKLISDDPGETTQGGPMLSSHKEASATCTISPQILGSKRRVQHHKPPNTLYSRRLLDREKARKELQLNVENKSSPLNSICVESNKVVLPKQAVNTSVNSEVKYERVVERKPTFMSEDLPNAIHVTDKSEESTTEKDDTVCMAVDIKKGSSTPFQTVTSEFTPTRTTLKVGSTAATECDVEVMYSAPLSAPDFDFRRRRRAKVISVSAGNKILFRCPTGTIHGRGNVDNKSALERDTVSCEKACVSSSENVICLSSDGDESGDDRQRRFSSDVEDSNSAVEVLRGQCENVNLNRLEELDPSRSLAQGNMSTDESSGSTSKALPERLNVAEPYVTSLVNTKPQDTSETKCITLVRRRRKPVCLGDSSFVVADTNKS